LFSKNLKKYRVFKNQLVDNQTIDKKTFLKNLNEITPVLLRS
jgi:hypothetical protein